MALAGGIAAPPEVLALGCITGLGYALVAVGLILTFRASGVVNLAHGQIGALAAAVLAVMVQLWHVPYWLAFAGAGLIGCLLGAVVELCVVRRLRSTPALLSLVATLGVAQVLLFASAAIAAELPAAELFPQPPGLPSTELGALTVTPAYWATVIVAVSAIAGLVAMLRMTSLGVALRATWANEEGARLLGLPGRRLTALTWGVAGALSALTAALSLPAGGSPDLPALGPALLVRALAVAVIARLRSLPVALAAGIAVGVMEQLCLWNSADPRLSDAVLLAAIVVVLLVRPRVEEGGQSHGSWAAIPRWPGLPARVRASTSVRWASRLPVAAAVVGAALAP
ncbi:MAG: branched-chain amino acid ABC transporter permease, partial [Actinomycetota bacterium]|nr:branched-chain amino acid ABC transporter permease [Actinomycetota bacterium]